MQPTQYMQRHFLVFLGLLFRLCLVTKHVIRHHHSDVCSTILFTHRVAVSRLSLGGGRFVYPSRLA